MPPPTEPAVSNADVRFQEFRRFSIRLGLLVAAVPAVALLLHWYLLHDIDRHALLASTGSTLALLVYPLAIVSGAPRRWLSWCMVGGLAVFMLLIIWGLSYLPDGYSNNLWLLLYPMLFGPLLGMPFSLRDNAEKMLLVLMIPVLAALAIPAFPLLQFVAMALPVLMVTIYFKTMVDRIIEKNHAYRLQIEALANRDALTGCYNRRYFMEEATRLLKQAQRSGLPACLVMLDIDHFKSVNDRHGHAAGDLVIRAVAQQLNTTLRETDLAARIGGEEFVALLPDTGRDSALTAAERLRLAIQNAGVGIPGLPEPLHCCASLGLALALEDGDTLDALLERADQALYAAKRGGRNRVICAAPDT